MAEIESKASVAPQAAPRRDVVEVILSSATEAAGGAFMFWILGGIAISIASGFAGDMIPSWPPGFAQSSEGGHASHHHGWLLVGQRNAFIFIFTLFFIHSLWVGFHGGGGVAAKRLKHILEKLRENWFGLIVGNAIGAWVATLMFGITQAFDFSLMHIVWQWLWGLVMPFVRDFGSFVFGSSNSASVGDWFSWYDANQTKLFFWFFYLSSILDDLGVPNFKTLLRWGWRRMRRPRGTVLPAA